jgi:hypothetical protein
MFSVKKSVLKKLSGLMKDGLRQAGKGWRLRSDGLAG